ncbi:protein of unknown function [Paraburkholderia kururiensis]
MRRRAAIPGETLQAADGYTKAHVFARMTRRGDAETHPGAADLCIAVVGGYSIEANACWWGKSLQHAVRLVYRPFNGR